MTKKTFHIIDGRRRVVGIVHGSAEGAVIDAQTHARVCPHGHFYSVEEVGGRGEIAVVGADGPVAA